ncbi:hypothetical protein FTW19_08305 [Terriglobus albidus]|uniref:NTF2 fold domain-containing protein n=1 Tax=Terriglobus albidus TaxID=1592106 RepID=A0A5B9ED33_9BACT|nr:NTF2 fold immunity protein [Terriglobus albidus]QEE27996.1 hypothetical protein FTW19_08305 [Terriglobus albidus]
MHRRFGLLLLSTMVAVGQNTRTTLPHPDYVPDEKTAEHIAEAVLIAQFGQERVNAQLPLRARIGKNAWLVQGMLKDKEGRPQVGGSFAVWINKHGGCLTVIERMK